MFLTYLDFRYKTKIKFEANRSKNYEELAKELDDSLKASSSICMCSSTRKVVESEEFWKKTGILMRNEDKIKIMKY